MGTDIHSVIQKRNLTTGKWETILSDVITVRDYELFGSLSGVRGYSAIGPILTDGLPDDFNNTEIRHAEHSFGWCTLEHFCYYRVNDVSPFNIEVDGNEVTLRFEPGHDILTALQVAWSVMFCDLDEHRLVVGYDS